MFWPFSICNLLYPKEKYIWARVLILHETDKAILIDNGTKVWVPKIANIWNKAKEEYF